MSYIQRYVSPFTNVHALQKLFSIDSCFVFFVVVFFPSPKQMRISSLALASKFLPPWNLDKLYFSLLKVRFASYVRLHSCLLLSLCFFTMEAHLNLEPFPARHNHAISVSFKEFKEFFLNYFRLSETKVGIIVNMQHVCFLGFFSRVFSPCAWSFCSSHSTNSTASHL